MSLRASSVRKSLRSGGDPEMQKRQHATEICLERGEVYFGDRNTRIRTTLGSCVSLTFWHPHLLVGGMCHYMLPTRSQERHGICALELDGRYADEAIEILMGKMRSIGAPNREYEVKLFGGGNMPPGEINPVSSVGFQNVDMAMRLVAQHGFNRVAENLGGNGHRNLIFDVWSGYVSVRHVVPVLCEGESVSGKERMQNSNDDRGRLCGGASGADCLAG